MERSFLSAALLIAAQVQLRAAISDTFDPWTVERPENAARLVQQSTAEPMLMAKSSRLARRMDDMGSFP